MKLDALLKMDAIKMLSNPIDSDLKAEGIYIGDLLSWVMGKGKIGAIWLTVLTHQNIIAVASLREFAAIVVCEGATVDEKTIALANQEKICLFTSSLPLYETSKLLEELF